MDYNHNMHAFRLHTLTKQRNKTAVAIHFKTLNNRIHRPVTTGPHNM